MNCASLKNHKIMRLPADATPQTFYLPSLAGSIDFGLMFFSHK